MSRAPWTLGCLWAFLLGLIDWPKHYGHPLDKAYERGRSVGSRLGLG